MSQPSKEWIKQRMNQLKRQTGFSFNQDLFISVLLCLVSGKDKYAILTAPSHRVAEVATMATQISHCLFGFTTANIVCHHSQAASDLIQSLFVSTLEDEQLTSKAVRDIKNHKLPQDSPETSTLHPISPVDFTLSIKRDKSQSRSMKETQRWTEAETMKRSSMNRLPQTLVVQSLDQANAVIQAALLELIVTKELKVSNARYTLPKPFLLLIVLPQGFDSSTISAQLLDRVFVSYPIHEPSQPSNSTRTYTGRRTAHIKAEEIKHLEDRASQVYINIDISRYIRDIVVGIRTHPLVKSGLTARASQELVLVTKSLAVIFGKEYLTPDLVSIAAEKVFGHRLRLTSPHLTPADVVAEILCLVYVPV